ncbi:MAG TPA: ribokinase [Myxococcales bacterium]|nr:ribokinase [Myxococcales bacterium]HIK85552.1 ribokinase [Myxococcales bacterium]
MARVQVLNFGSLNVDHVYRVSSLVRPGETLSSKSYERRTGGKGFNQSIALSRAGAQVCHAGRIGEDGTFLRDTLKTQGVNVDAIAITSTPTGHAIIQVDDAGENAIVLYGGANRDTTRAHVEETLSSREPGSTLLLQNEVSCTSDIIELGLERGLRIAFNPAPMTADIENLPLADLSLLVVNADEGRALCGERDAPNADVLDLLHSRYPQTPIALTAGGDGAHYVDRDTRIHQPAEKVNVIDTTGAGDSFVGHFLAAQVAGASSEDCLKRACRAAAESVTHRGAT